MPFNRFGHWQVYDESGRRKYVSEAERARFLAAADDCRPDVRALCHVLVCAGCRVSEALALTPAHLDLDRRVLVIKTLKRRRLVFRTVPIPEDVVAMLLSLPAGQEDRFWPMHRTTAWRHIRRVMGTISVQGPMACCRGLRHGFGMRAAERAVPLNLIQRWMGHSHPAMTSHYIDAVGLEERAFAERMWR